MRSNIAIRRSLVIAALLALQASLTVWAQDPRLAKAEAIYKDVYGAEHDKAVAGTPAVRIAFAKKLLTAAGQVGDDAALKSVILSKALKIASSTPTGGKTALEIYSVLSADPKAKAAHAGELAAVLEKMLTAEPAAGKPKVAGDLVAAYRDWGAEQCRRGDAGATKSLQRARDLARTYLGANGKDLLKEIEEQLKLVDKDLQQSKDLARLTDLLEMDPKHVEANVGMALIEIKSNRVQNAAERLWAINVKAISQLGVALAAKPKPTAREVAAAAYIAAGAVTQPSHKIGLLNLARQNYEVVVATPGRFDALAAREYLGVLTALLAAESGTTRLGLAEQLVWTTIDVAGHAVEAGDPDVAAQVLGDTRATCKRYPGLLAPLSELDSFEKEIKSRLDVERERTKYQDALKAKPDDAKANWGMALIMMRSGRPAEAAPYLAKQEAADFRNLAQLLTNANATDLEKGETLRKLAGGLNATDKNALLCGARDYYEAFLAKTPVHPEVGRVKLLLSQLPDSPARKSKPGAGAIALFDGNKKENLVSQFADKGEGDGKVSLDEKHRYGKQASLRATPGFRNAIIPGWKYPIVEYPQHGQYRFIAFAWKKEGGSRMGFFVRSERKWYGYGAGDDQPDRLMIAKSVPTQWTVVVRDLFKDFGGPFDIVGLGLTPLDGVAGYYDAVFLGRTEAEVRAAAQRR